MNASRRIGRALVVAGFGTLCGAAAVLIAEPRAVAPTPILDETPSLQPTDQLAESSIPRPDAANPAAAAIERIVGMAADDPAGALEAALALDDFGMRRWGLVRVATAWAQTDPEAAVEAADRLPASLRKLYRRRVIEEWARTDSDAVFAWLGRVDPAIVPPRIDLAGLVAADPDRVLRIAARLPPRVRREFQAASLGALVRLDPDAALARIAAIPAGSGDRDRLVASVAGRYIEVDPEAGLLWAERFDSTVPGLYREAIAAVAAKDVDRAFDLVTTLPGAESDRIGAFDGLVSALRQRWDRAPELADALSRQRDGRGARLLPMLMAAWSANEPAGAFDWMLEHPDAVDLVSLRYIAGGLAGRNLEQAIDATSRVPAALAAGWVAELAGPYLRDDPAAALAWLEAFRGRPPYDYALPAAARVLLPTDPEAVTRLLAGAGEAARDVLIPQFARAWARRDPEAAAQWAAGLADPSRRAAALDVVNRGR